MIEKIVLTILIMLFLLFAYWQYNGIVNDDFVFKQQQQQKQNIGQEAQSLWPLYQAQQMPSGSYSTTSVPTKSSFKDEITQDILAKIGQQNSAINNQQVINNSENNDLVINKHTTTSGSNNKSTQIVSDLISNNTTPPSIVSGNVNSVPALVSHIQQILHKTMNELHDTLHTASDTTTASQKAAAEKAAAEKATAEKATAEKATAEKATAEKAAAEKATAEKAAVEKATAEKATAAAQKAIAAAAAQKAIAAAAAQKAIAAAAAQKAIAAAEKAADTPKPVSTSTNTTGCKKLTFTKYSSVQPGYLETKSQKPMTPTIYLTQCAKKCFDMSNCIGATWVNPPYTGVGTCTLLTEPSGVIIGQEGPDKRWSYYKKNPSDCELSDGSFGVGYLDGKQSSTSYGAIPIIDPSYVEKGCITHCQNTSGCEGARWSIGGSGSGTCELLGSDISGVLQPIDIRWNSWEKSSCVNCSCVNNPGGFWGGRGAYTDCEEGSTTTGIFTDLQCKKDLTTNVLTYTRHGNCPAK